MGKKSAPATERPIIGRRLVRRVSAPRFRIEPHADPAVAFRLEHDVAGWPRVLPEVERRFRMRPAAHFAARDEAGELGGGVSVVVHHDAGAGPLAWIGGLVVRPEARSAGLGRRLLREAIAFAEAEGAAGIGLDASPPGVPLYESEGFRTVAFAQRWSREASAPRPAAPRLETAAVYPISSCEIMELHAYDAPRFGAGRSAFLAELIGAHPERSFVAFDKKAGHVVGYALGQERFIGPIVADSPDIAARLLLACERAGAPALAYPLEAGAPALDVLMAAGYSADKEVGRFRRMLRGVGALPGRPETQYATGAGAIG